MFGYVRPPKSELRVREFDQFKACYCSLCHSLSREYGVSARFILNFDFLFLTMLLWPTEKKPEYEKRTCPASPFCKKQCCIPQPFMKTVDAYSIILAYWKLRDSMRDDGFIRSLGARFAALALRRAYKRARNDAPQFDAVVSEKLAELTELEKNQEPSLDRAADKFASIIASAVPEGLDGAFSRELSQVLYHTGRWIYIIDAVNDLNEDFKQGVYNPVAVRFGIENGVLGGEAASELRLTLENSLNLVRSAFELMPENVWAEIIRNIIYLGMPTVTDAVFSGKFRNTRDGMPR